MMKPHTVLITGATRGIGLAAAQALAQQGWQVVIAGRSPERLDSALQSIRSRVPGARVAGLLGDLSLQADVRGVASAFLARYERLDALVNNVGLNTMRYSETADGLETTWAINYLNHFLLTHLLLDRLTTTAAHIGQARIVEVTSSMFRIAGNTFSRRPARKGYNGALAYAYSKRAMMVFTCELARRLAGTGVTVNAVTPGFVATNIASGSNPAWARWTMALIRRFSLPVEEGAQPVVRLVTDPALQHVTGQYFYRYRAARMPGACQDKMVAQQLWALSEQEIQQPKTLP